MHTVVNFLPWRRALFYRQLRRWGLLACGIVLIAAITALALRSHWQLERAINDTQASAQRQINQLLSQREQQRNAQAKRNAWVLQRLARRQDTLEWSQRLLEIVERLPAQAWLDELSFRDGALWLSGTLIQFSALATLDDGLQNLPGFQPGKAGKIQRDNAGRWLFQYQLQKGVANAAP